MAFVLFGRLLSLLYFLLNVFVGCSSVNLFKIRKELLTLYRTFYFPKQQ